MKKNNLLKEKFPFLCIFEFAEEEYIGLIQNIGRNIVSVYVYNNISEPQMKRLFLEYGQQWWDESNRLIPINLFFREDFDIFNFCLKTFNTKEINIIEGYALSIKDTASKRVKRKKIELIKK